MRKHLGLSVLALMAALGVAAPAQAQLLNLGDSGDGISVNVGGSGGATVTLFGDDPVDVDVGGDGSGTATIGDVTSGFGIDLGGATNGNLIDIDGDGDDDDALIDLDFGDIDEDPVANVDGNALLDLDFGDGGGGGDAFFELFGDGTDASGDAVVNIDLGDSNDVIELGDLVDLGDVDGGLLDLGDVDGDLLALDGLLGGDVAGDDVLLDLFGDGTGTGNVAIDLSGETDDPNDVTLALDDDSNVIVDIFGDGTTGGLGTGLGGDGTPDLTADLGGPNLAIDILGLGNADETGGGNGGGAGDGGGSSGGGSDNGGGATNGNGVAGGDTTGVSSGVIGGGDDPGLGGALRIASAGDSNVNCFSPNGNQIEYLLRNHTYGATMQANWATGEIDLVPIRLCPEARARLAAAIETDYEIQWLQNAVWADRRIRSALVNARLDEDNVLALDTKDGDVNVYVF